MEFDAYDSAVSLYSSGRLKKKTVQEVADHAELFAFLGAHTNYSVSAAASGCMGQWLTTGA